MANALVTGGALRIGRAIALELSENGFGIAVHYRDSVTSARQLVEEIQAAGGIAAAVKCDLANTADTATLIVRATDAIGPIDALVNNASLFEPDTIEDLTPGSWEAHLAINLEAPVFLAKSMLDHLPANMTGAVVNVIDQRVLNPGPEFFSYTLSKSALHTATRMLAQALAPKIRVNAVAPGPVLQSIHQTPADFEAEARSTILGHGASPEDIAAAVRFLLMAPAITGQMLAVDGGQHLSRQPVEP